MLLKVALLFFSIIFVLPMVFFLLVGCCGKHFSLTIDRNSWLAKTNIKWIKVLMSRFVV